MIVGIDCYHDIAAGKRSIGALVASLNHSMTRLVSNWGGHPCTEQCGADLDWPYFSHVYSLNSVLWREKSGLTILGFFGFPWRWYSKCVLQDKGQEIMDGLKMALTGKFLFSVQKFLHLHEGYRQNCHHVFQVPWKTIWSSTAACRHASLCTEMEWAMASCTVWLTMRCSRSWTPSGQQGRTTCEFFHFQCGVTDDTLNLLPFGN